MLGIGVAPRGRLAAIGAARSAHAGTRCWLSVPSSSSTGPSPSPLRAGPGDGARHRSHADTGAGLIALKTLALALAALPIAAAVEGRPRRAAIAIAAGVLWAVATVGTSLTITVWGLLVVFLLDGISSGAVAAVHHPLLVDSYRPEVRMRVVSAYEAIASAGVLISPVVVAVASVWWGLTWRGVFLTLGVLALAAAIFSMRLRDPGFGTFDHARIRSAVRAQDGEGGVPSQDDGAVGLRFSEAVRRILLVPTARRLLIAYAAIGMALVPTTTYLFFFLDFRWGLGVGPRSVVYAVVAVAQIVALLLLSRPVQSRFERDPRGVVRLGAVLLTGSMVSFALMALAPARARGGVHRVGLRLAAVTPIASVVGMTIVEPSLRLPALSGIFYAGVGGLGGVLLLGASTPGSGSAAPSPRWPCPAAVRSGAATAAHRDRRHRPARRPRRRAREIAALTRPVRAPAAVVPRSARPRPGGGAAHRPRGRG
jgi:MFS family permease